MVWKHVRSIVLLPVVMTIVVPAWIVYRTGTDTLDLADNMPALRIAIGALGLFFLAAGLVLVIATNWLFATIGRGTLAPWNPTRHLVAVGVYRHVRNPMISGVISLLLGESLLAASLPLLEWNLLFATTNFLYIPLVEERELRWRFGEPYEHYRRHVPRWIPRRRAWQA